MTDTDHETVRALLGAWAETWVPPAPLQEIVTQGRRLRRRRRCAALAVSVTAGFAVLAMSGTANGLTPTVVHPANASTASTVVLVVPRAPSSSVGFA